MTPSALFRASAVALVLAAVALAVAEVLSFSILAAQGGDYDLGEIARSGIFFLQSLFTLLAGILLLGGLLGIYLRQSGASGKLGFVGFLVAFLGTALVVGNFYANTFVTPMVALGDPAFLDDPLSVVLQAWLPFSFGLLALSWLLFAVATLRARVYPRGPSWLLLIGAVVALVPIPLAKLPFYTAVGWVGLHLSRASVAADTARSRTGRPGARSR
jgi:hypothetical protein